MNWGAKDHQRASKQLLRLALPPESKCDIRGVIQQPSDSPLMENFWEMVGKFGLAASSLLGGVKLYEWIRDSRTRLRCEYKTYPFALPTGLREELRLFKPDTPTHGLAFIKSSFSYGQIDVVSGFIENVGQQPIEEVELRISGAKLWRLSDRGEGASLNASNEKLAVGRLRAMERVHFEVWREQGFNQQIVVSHSKGVARLRELKFTGALGHSIEQFWTKNWVAVVFFGTLVVLAIVAGPAEPIPTAPLSPK